MTVRAAQSVSETSRHSSLASRLRQATLHEFSWIWWGTVLIFAVSAVIAPGTVRGASILSMLPFAAILAIAAAGQTIVIQQRGLDLSIPGIMAISGLILAKVALITGSIPLAVAAALGAALLAGVVNGLLVAVVNITPIVVTLATNAILLGAVRTISGGSPVVAPDALAEFSHQTVVGVPMTLVLALAFVILISGATRRTVHGRRFTAVGANPAAAEATGIPILRYQVSTYAIAALCYAVAGMLFAGFIGSASPTAGNDYLLPAIAAVVVGGTPFTGGRGSVVASAVAALFITQLGQMVLALGASTAVQLLVQALAITLAVLIRHVASLGRLLK
jgi:ribose transport system permease protein